MSDTEEKKPRGIGRPFQKGVSGNPGGRPKEAEWLREEARKHAEKSIRALVRVLNKGSGSEVVSAAKELLDRGFGKSTQALEHSGPEGLALPLIVLPSNGRDDG